jgi:hypothetical protein
MANSKIFINNGIGTSSLEAIDESISVNSPFNGFGLIPLGGIVAVANVAAWSLPLSGQIKEGYALCNGQSFPPGSNPLFSGTVPNLTDERFIQGSTLPGATGGSNTYTVQSSLGNIDFSHSHTVDGHRHDIRHTHMWSSNYNGDNYTRNGSDGYDLTSVGTQKAWSLSEYSPNGIDDLGEAGITRNYDYYYTAGVNNSPSGHGSGSTANSGSTSPGTNSKSLTYSAGHAHNILNSSGSATTDFRPKYFNVVYLIRVK